MPLLAGGGPLDLRVGAAEAPKTVGCGLAHCARLAPAATAGSSTGTECATTPRTGRSGPPATGAAPASKVVICSPKYAQPLTACGDGTILRNGSLPF